MEMMCITQVCLRRGVCIVPEGYICILELDRWYVRESAVEQCAGTYLIIMPAFFQGGLSAQKYERVFFFI